MPGAGGSAAGTRRRVRLALRLVTLAALGYVAYVAAANLSALVAQDLPGAVVVTAALLVPAYGAALLLLAENWHRLVGAVGAPAPGRALTWPAFTDSQLAKYLPGNVMHIVLRHVRLRETGLSHRTLALAFGAETASLALGALVLAVLALSLAPAGAGWPAELWGAYRLPVQAGTAALAVLVLGLGLHRARRTGGGGAGLLLSPGLVLAFFAVSGLCYYAICRGLSDRAGPELAGLAVLAWLAGFLTPGAPGGLGPREAVLLALSAPALGEPAALVAIALFRLVTLLGDLACFAAGRVLFGRVLFGRRGQPGPGRDGNARAAPDAGPGADPRKPSDRGTPGSAGSRDSR